MIPDTLQPKEVNSLSTTTELAQLHELIGGLRRCVTSLASRYGDTPAMRRIVNDAHNWRGSGALMSTARGMYDFVDVLELEGAPAGAGQRQAA